MGVNSRDSSSHSGMGERGGTKANMAVRLLGHDGPGMGVRGKSR